jgi:phosphopantothenoylcysteine decarboxylase/phosphopantothenate--cysteine ligase
MFKRVVIVSGPTVEPIDPVRFISNRSSGKSGFQLANEAKKREIEEIVFISGPTCYRPEGVEFIAVETALEMREQVFRYRDTADVILMAAAVSDYRVEHYSEEKIKKDRDTLTLQLVKNPDILFELGQRKGKGQVLVGYAAETDHIFENARKKFERKNVDLLILNEVSSRNPAFNAEENQVYFVTRDGIRKLERLEKSTLAVRVWDEIYRLSKAGIGSVDEMTKDDKKMK